MGSPSSGRPLLKWAGGKRQLLPALRPWFPRSFSRYIEPFFGSGAVFFDLAAHGELRQRQALLVDVNPDLVGCYLAVRDQTEAVITALSKLADAHARHGADCYYDVRDRQFNPARARGEHGTPELAAMLIYLNRTGFNGLYRVNRDGAFNVPAGRYASPTVCDADHIGAVAAVLRRPGVTLRLGSFDKALAAAGDGDFVYCDPPYAPLTRTASFAHYTAGGFTPDDQARLQQAVVGAAARGATVIVSNSSAALIERLYSAPAARTAGLRVHRVPARRAINSRASARGAVDELVITNARREITVPRPEMLRARLKPATRKRA
jgi:DNA adenine methylase